MLIFLQKSTFSRFCTFPENSDRERFFVIIIDQERFIQIAKMGLLTYAGNRSAPRSENEEAELTSMIVTDLEQPLLPLDCDIRHDASLYLSCDDGLDSDIFRALNAQLRFMGLFVGFLIQILSLGATAFMASRWGEHASYNDQKDLILYVFLLVFSKGGLSLYPLVCFPIIFSMTQAGVECAQTMLLKKRETVFSTAFRRLVFLMGVNFLAGLIVGSFLAWVSIDVFFGLSSLMIPTIGALCVCLALCYAMVLFYDKQHEVEDSSA